MVNIYTKFEQLPREVKKTIGSKEAIKILETIEKKYNIDLMHLVLMVVTKEIKLENLENFFQEEFEMAREEARNLTLDLKDKIFKPILDYLQEKEITEIKEEKLEENEIKELKTKMGEIKPVSIDDPIQEIIKKSNLPFSDEVLLKRLKNIIAARLREVRDKIETREALIKSQKIGGLDLEENEADKVIAIIETEIKKLEEKFRKEAKLSKFEIPLAIKPISVKPRETVILEKKKEIAAKPAEIIKPKINFTPQAPIKQKLVKAPLKEERIEAPKPAKIVSPVIVKKPEVKNNFQPAPNKPLMEDIRAPRKITEKEEAEKKYPRTMGPLEELRYLSLNDFRRLSDSPQGATAKIKQKIDLLEKDSFAKKIQGIKNWRQNEVYRMYLGIGRESIEKNKGTTDIIQERINRNKPILSEEEFEAVADLNELLRF